MRNRLVNCLFITAAIIDLITYNPDKIPIGVSCYFTFQVFIYYLTDLPIQNKIYFLGTAVAGVMFLLSFAIYAHKNFLLDLFLWSYFSLACNNLYDEITNNNLVGYPAEYWFLLFAVLNIFYKIHVRKRPDRKLIELIYSLRHWIMMKIINLTSE
jgi:hypothetical protein